jgi:hypothetical protein
MGEAADTRWALRCGVLGALVLLCSVACGKASHSTADGEGGSGTLPGSGGSTAMASGHAGSAAGRVPLPNATEEEQRALAPLYIDSAEIYGADVPRLIEIGATIGIARGYALCRCAQPGLELADDLMPCAVGESGQLAFTRSPPQSPGQRLDADLARCLHEESVLRPWLADVLRCQLRQYQEDGRAWLELCSQPGFDGDSATYPMTPFECPGVDETMLEEFSSAVHSCREVAYCDDGTRVLGRRCSGAGECPDWSDEGSCFDIVGQDTMQCGDELTRPWELCLFSSCGDDATPSLCDDTGRRLQCPDGTELSEASVCDRRDDCADGADEHYCFR